MKRVRLKDDWRLIIKKAWSFRLAVLAAIFSALEMVLPFFAPIFPAKLFAALSFATILAAGVARIVAQPQMYRSDK